MPTIEEVLALAIHLGVVKQDKVKGCNNEELKTLERELKIVLPNAYKEFLLWCGRGAGQFIIWGCWQYYKANLTLL